MQGEVEAMLIKVWHTEIFAELGGQTCYTALGPLICTSTDGFSVFQRAGADRSEGKVMLRQSGGGIVNTEEMAGLLEKLVLMNQEAGDHGITSKYDPKHAAKRTRARMKTVNMGMTVGVLLTAYNFNHGVFEFWLSAIGTSPSDIKQVLNPEENMDVSAVVKLLDALSKFPDLDFDNGNDVRLNEIHKTPPRRAQFKDLQLLGNIARCMHTNLFGADLSVSAHLTNLSTLGHLLFVSISTHSLTY
jgi:hypothetical protein